MEQPTTCSNQQHNHTTTKYCNPHQHPVGVGQHLTLTNTSIIQLQYIPTHQHSIGVGLHYQLPILVDTSRLLASYNINIPTHQHPVGVGLHYQLPIWVDTSRLLASYNYNIPTNTPASGRRGATLSATYLGGHLMLTSIIQLHMYNRIAIQLQNIKSQTC